jgi:PhnB protein
MSVIAYLNFDGNAAQAIDFYAKAFNAEEVKIVKYRDLPQDPNAPMPSLPENEYDMIMESSIAFAGGKIMISDLLSVMKQEGSDLVKGNNLLISIVNESKSTLESYFSRLSVGGHVIAPLSSMPWSSCFGMLVDQFGIVWKFNGDADKFLDHVLSMKQS